jgi:hypothetical protein
MPETIPRVVLDWPMSSFKESPTATARPARCCGCFLMAAISLFVSDAIIRELHDVLSRPEVRPRLPGINDRIVNAFLTKLEAQAIKITNVPEEYQYEPDPDDRDVHQSRDNRERHLSRE